ncbi:hypothetical protein [Corallococcus llansteffanensis]|uniref:Uncharacterized protein n=1 Tax=Corallococcus llansteffanensis TaxID=2316731 RepID=A0A3A8QGQ1_9BACT|nr:hypothetical protein [Corallococcus llansteffanensis]RKH66070.1 hypothetical protein D7V93_05000 [Corallococcus llansteffanensis]
MSLPVAALATTAMLRRTDPVRGAVERLAQTLPARADATVLLDFVEDDLREGLDALGDVQAHFHDLLQALQREALTPVALLNAGEDLHVLQRLEDLHEVVTHLRRRLSQAAGMIRRG